MKYILLWSVISSITSSVTSQKLSVTSSTILPVTSQDCSKVEAYGCSSDGCDDYTCENICGLEMTSRESPSIMDIATEQCESGSVMCGSMLPVKIATKDEHDFLRGFLCNPRNSAQGTNAITSGLVTIKKGSTTDISELRTGVNVTWLGWQNQTEVDWVNKWVMLDLNGNETENQAVSPGNFYVVLLADGNCDCSVCSEVGDAFKAWGLLPEEATVDNLYPTGAIELRTLCQKNINDISSTMSTTTVTMTSTHPTTTTDDTPTTTVTSTSTIISTTTTATTTTLSSEKSTLTRESTTVTPQQTTSSTPKPPTTKSTTVPPTSISPCCCPLDDDKNVCQGEHFVVSCPPGFTGNKTLTCNCNSKCSSLVVENRCITQWISDSKDKIENGSSPGLEIAQEIENNTFIYQNLSNNDLHMLIPMLANLTELMSHQVSELDEETVELKIIEYVGTLTNITYNLLRGHISWSNLNQTERALLGPELLLELEQSSFLLAVNINQNKTFCKTWKREFLQLLKIQVQTTWQDDVIFPDENNGSFIHLPQNLMQESSEGRFVGLMVRSDAAAKILPPTANIFFNDLKVVNSPLVSATLNWTGNRINISQEEDVTMVFHHQVLESGAAFRYLYRDRHPDEVPTPVPRSADCVFWDVKKSKWSNDGCRLIQTNASETHCICNHLTMFAIITDVHGFLGRDNVLDILGSVLCSASVVSLFTALILLHFCQKSNIPTPGGSTNPRTTITKQLCVAMGFFHLLLMLLLDRDILKLDKISCVVSGMILHYLGLATMFWMLAEGIHLYQRVVNVLSPTILLPAYWFLGYGVPLVIVVSTIMMAYSSSHDPWVEQEAYASDEYCWLDPESGYLWAFTGPLIAVIVANTIIMMLALRSAAIIEVNRRKSLPQHLRMWVRGVFSLNCILGISWVFGLMYIEANHVLAYVFTIFNASQGVALLVLHCLVNDNIQLVLSSKLPCCGRNKHTRKSRTYHPSQYRRSLGHTTTGKQQNVENNRSKLSSDISQNKYNIPQRQKYQEDEHRQPNIIIKNVEVTEYANVDDIEKMRRSHPENTDGLHRRSGLVNIHLGLHLDLDLANSIASECHNCQQGYDERCTQGCKYSYSPPALKYSPSFAQHRQRLNRGGSNWSQDTQLTIMSNDSDDTSRKTSNESFASYEYSPSGSISGSPSLSKASSVPSTSFNHTWEHFMGCYDNPNFDLSFTNSRFEHPACSDNPRFIPEFGSIPECDEKSPLAENNVQFFK